MKTLLRVMAGLLFAVPLSMSAQTVAKSDTFTFVGGQVRGNPPAQQDPCAPIIAWDGVVNAYPMEMGGVCPNGYFTSLLVPFQLGYLNNGDLDPCDPLVWGPKTFTKGDGTHAGDTYTQSGGTSCPYFTGEYGTYENSNNRLEGWSITANFQVDTYTTYYHNRAILHYFVVLVGGTGVVTDTIINQ